MVRRLIAASMVLSGVLAAWPLDLGVSREARAGGHRESTAGDLFYNYYVPPGTPCGVGAELYPCPRPVPPLVGHTFVTYQPLMPQEFLYKHHRKYWNWHPESGWTRTVVTWQ